MASKTWFSIREYLHDAYDKENIDSLWKERKGTEWRKKGDHEYHWPVGFESEQGEFMKRCEKWKEGAEDKVGDINPLWTEFFFSSFFGT